MIQISGQSRLLKTKTEQRIQAADTSTAKKNLSQAAAPERRRKRTKTGIRIRTARRKRRGRGRRRKKDRKRRRRREKKRRKERRRRRRNERKRKAGNGNTKRAAKRKRKRRRRRNTIQVDLFSSFVGAATFSLTTPGITKTSLCRVSWRPSNHLLFLFYFFRSVSKPGSDPINLWKPDSLTSVNISLISSKMTLAYKRIEYSKN